VSRSRPSLAVAPVADAHARTSPRPRINSCLLGRRRRHPTRTHRWRVSSGLTPSRSTDFPSGAFQSNPPSAPTAPPGPSGTESSTRALPALVPPAPVSRTPVLPSGTDRPVCTIGGTSGVGGVRGRPIDRRGPLPPRSDRSLRLRRPHRPLPAPSPHPARTDRARRRGRRRRARRRLRAGRTGQPACSQRPALRPPPATRWRTCRSQRHGRRGAGEGRRGGVRTRRTPRAPPA